MKKTECRHPGITIDRWGPSAWNTLHSFAHRAPDVLTKQEQEEWGVSYICLLDVCPVRSAAPISKNISTNTSNRRPAEEGANIVRFDHDAHNNVNERLGKDVWTFEEHTILYSRAYNPTTDLVSVESLPCTDCRPRTGRHLQQETVQKNIPHRQGCRQ